METMHFVLVGVFVDVAVVSVVFVVVTRSCVQSGSALNGIDLRRCVQDEASVEVKRGIGRRRRRQQQSSRAAASVARRGASERVGQMSLTRLLVALGPYNMARKTQYLTYTRDRKT